MGTAIFDKANGKMVNWAARGSVSFDEDTQVAGTFDIQPVFSENTHFYNTDTENIEPLSASEVNKRTYALNRALAYPKFGDQLDVIWKHMGGQELSAESQDMLDAINKVKNDYPK
jgi:hypothetical protein